ncbi:septal ring lytic transglycosylase RlpA family protein [Erythrobacter sp. WG]|uniref:septal ring lytic transglycosylase RlpA family protein n=1 Tax=Erythrobacter sp. WG TaxID=2985510 RepID=UPI00226E028E|nr:septal ring lytic transglycosylase RlpA family protein [Erythrobacter sp. WG]MCX9146825.1 septal ring lytic transglycosylase RlpA family protein [Erythrobacter sp. WG]
MRTAYPTHGLATSSFGPRTLKAATLAALVALAPIGASTAIASDAPSNPALERAATSAAVVELVPIAPTPQVSAAAPVDEAAPSRPEATVLGRGSASYYAAKFDGRRTASGERFDNDEMTAAHRTLPFGSRVRVTSVASGKSVVVRINDRGPFHAGRILDLSRAAAEELGLVARGSGTVELELIED